MGDTDIWDEFDDKELEVVNALVRKCISRRNRLKERCVMQKLTMQVIVRSQIQDQIIDDLKKDNAFLKVQSLLNSEKDAARQMVDGLFKRLHITGLQILGAVEMAAQNYDAILQARADKGVVGDIIANLIITFLPELRILQKTFSLFVGIKFTGKLVSPATTKVITKSFAAVQKVDQRLDDIIQSINGPISAGSGMDGESQARYAAYAAKNQIFSRTLEQLYAALDSAYATEMLLQSMIIAYPQQGVQSFVQNMLKKTGLVDIPYGPIKPTETNQSTFSLLSDLILYDMLRAYVSNYVTIGFAIGRPSASQVKVWPQFNNDIDGLDIDQRTMIYKKFHTVRWNYALRKISWNDPNIRPSISSYKDLVLHWGAGIKTFGFGAQKVKL